MQDNPRLFAEQLATYRQTIDADIATYAQYIRKSTREQYGEVAALEIDTFLSILDRGGKRIRGALTMCGYEMSGGTDTAMIQQAARAMEMIHAYLLIVDDIQDNSLVRRGGPAAHALLAEYHRKHKLKGSAEHFGVALGLSAAMAGAHAAMTILANLNVKPLLRANTMSIMNRTLLVTHHGQVNDIMNEVISEVRMEDIERVMDWKTATYSFLNPLHVGMVLAGADCHATDAITPYAHHVGIAFQITDDILGTFSDEVETGKSPMDDIREGKYTLMIAYALEHTRGDDRDFLRRTLGNADLTPSEFKRCKEILQNAGAHEFAAKEAHRHIAIAQKTLSAEAHRWPASNVHFLQGITEYVTTRIS